MAFFLRITVVGAALGDVRRRSKPVRGCARRRCGGEGSVTSSRSPRRPPNVKLSPSGRLCLKLYRGVRSEGSIAIGQTAVTVRLCLGEPPSEWSYRRCFTWHSQ